MRRLDLWVRRRGYDGAMMISTRCDKDLLPVDIFSGTPRHPKISTGRFAELSLG